MKNTFSSYVSIFQQSPNGGYTVSFPQFPGCVTFGNSFNEAEKMAQEALELWLEELSAKDILPIQPIIHHVTVGHARTKKRQKV